MQRKRAVAYVRVSTKSDAQSNSFEFQERYWADTLANDDNVRFVGIYADHGISGRDVRRREHFNEMLEDARKGKFDVIYTKSVSRFSRNVTQLLESVRELRELNVEVIFENENIHTFQPSSEIYLTLAATIAENELKTDSDRMRWSIRDRFAKGYIAIGSKCYGYKLVADNQLEIVPEQAEVVRMIYDMYLSGMGICKIMRELRDRKIPNGQGTTEWTITAIRYILANEKYMGDSLSQKSVTIDAVSYKNDGTLAKQYYIEDSHPAIVSKETYAKVQAEKKRRGNPKLTGFKVPEYDFTHMIVCGDCGKTYRHKIRSAGTKYKSSIWKCSTACDLGADACSTKPIKDSVLKEKFVEAYNEFVTSYGINSGTTEYRDRLQELLLEEQELRRLEANHLISVKDYNRELADLMAKINATRKIIDDNTSKDVTKRDFKTIDKFDNEKLHKFIRKVIMYKYIVTFEFYNGVQISKAYDNGKAGNQVGWKDKIKSKE